MRSMKKVTLGFRWLGASLGALVLSGLAQQATASTPTSPSLQGAYPVGCSNVEQDISRVKAGETPADYWEGNPGATARYVTDLLVAPDRALTYKINVPAKSQIDVFDRTGGTQLQYAAIACYPTTAVNTRANYPLPDGRVPRMERGADTPIIATNPSATDGKWPLIVLSHGLAGSPLGNEYIQVIERLAAEGYVVFAPFHADARYSRTKVEDLADAVYVLARYGEIAEMQALRPVGLKQGLDYILSKPEYANVIDQDQVVGFGASLGGMAMMLAQGSKMTTSLGGTERTILRDNRYKAVVGYVPFSGYSFQPAFGDSNQGVKGIRVPYLGIGGTADVVAPISRTSQAINALSGSKYFVTIEGMPHGLRPQDAPELFGWTFSFYKAQLSRNQADRNAFNEIVNFAGNADDRMQIRKTLGWGPRDELEVVEYALPQSGKFFMTGTPGEIALLDGLPTLFQRTGVRFATFRQDSTQGLPMCRFYGNDGGRLNTHFYSTLPADCAAVRAQPWAVDEGIAMRATALSSSVAATGCSLPDTEKIVRLFNINTANHRYLPQSVVERSVFTAEWAAEGAVFCAAKYE
jgi:predicted dienelactone hydrolase